MRKTVLLVESSLRGAAVGLAELEEGLVQWRALSLHLDSHAATQSLHNLLRQALSSCSATLDEVDAIIVGHGPGSFTGIKVGLAFALGLQTGTQKSLPVYGVPALGVLARQESVVAVLAANRQQGYFAHTNEAGQLVFGIVDLKDGLAFWDEERRPYHFAAPQQFLLVTPWPEWQEKFSAELGHIFHAEPAVSISKAMVAMASHCMEEILAGKAPPPLAPFYLRDSAPQEKLRTQPVGK